jgi:hypothetical protein
MIGYLAIKKKDKLLLPLQSVYFRYGIWMKDLNLLINTWKEMKKIYKLVLL